MSEYRTYCPMCGQFIAIYCDVVHEAIYSKPCGCQPTRKEHKMQINDNTRAKFTNAFLALIRDHFGEFKTVEGGPSHIRIAHVIHKMHENSIELQALKKEHEGVKRFLAGNQEIIKTYEARMKHLEEAINAARHFIEACDR